MKYSFIMLISLVLLISCNRDSRELVVIKPTCTSKKKSIVGNKEFSEQSILDINELIKENAGQNYSFEIDLPKSIEYCGYLSNNFCSIGEPDKFMMIDTSVTKTYFINIEVDKHDQKNYEYLINSIKKYPNFKSSKDELEYNEGLERSEKRMGVIKKNEIMKTKSILNDFEFYGQGRTILLRNGIISNEYNIYGYKGEFLIHLKMWDDINRDQKANIEELYCLAKSLKIKKGH